MQQSTPELVWLGTRIGMTGWGSNLLEIIQKTKFWSHRQIIRTESVLEKEAQNSLGF